MSDDASKRTGRTMDGWEGGRLTRQKTDTHATAIEIPNRKGEGEESREQKARRRND
jgi:hypothetical protein